ncbi:hypothetical protein USB125703_01333 [Pseudoclavibacter triregionum]|nr:hypothetical protein USB125703_01333 [Pseudoclavibacter triregionum]
MASGSRKPGDRTPDLSRVPPPGGGPLGPSGIDPSRLEEARRRADRSSGISLLILGIGMTIMSMTMLTENAMATQFSALFEQYGIEPYVRPAGLGALATAGLIGHPLIYALTLYTTLLRWRRGKRAMWIILLGALAGAAFTFGIISTGITMHPELMHAIQTGATPTPTP